MKITHVMLQNDFRVDAVDDGKQRFEKNVEETEARDGETHVAAQLRADETDGDEKHGDPARATDGTRQNEPINDGDHK